MSDLSATALDYQSQIVALLPPGPAWPQDDVVLEAAAQEPARVHARLLALVDEADPRTTVELLPDWERVAGLPDACMLALGVTQGYAQRITALVAKLSGLGGQSRAFFITLAQALGYQITISEFVLHTVESPVDAPLNAAPLQFVWQVNARNVDNSGGFTVLSGVDEPLSWSGSGVLECLLQAARPAHTYIVFNYS